MAALPVPTLVGTGCSPAWQMLPGELSWGCWMPLQPDLSPGPQTAHTAHTQAAASQLKH